MNNITNEFIAWAAGFYEGEGSTQNQNSRRLGTGRGSIQVIIPQTNKEPLEKLKDVFGGSLFPTNAYKKKEQWNQAFQWSIAAVGAKRFVNMIYPYLSEKRRLQILKAFMNSPVPRARPGLTKGTEDYKFREHHRYRSQRRKGVQTDYAAHIRDATNRN